MSAVRPSDGLLPAVATLALVSLLADCPHGSPVEPLLRDLAATIPISWSRANNTIAKLSQYGAIEPEGAGLIRLANSPAGGWRDWIAGHVAAELSSRLTEKAAWSCISFDQPSGEMIIDAMILPNMNDGLAMWVIDFGIAGRPSTETRFWSVNPIHRPMFVADLRRANAGRTRRAKSAERLAAELARQAADGEAAEQWVLQFERRRLADHPFCNLIRQVSADDVAAGYDIVSFASLSSTEHDLFIEVKSHGIRKAFHWSRNEIATAADFGDAYALYLVDREQCSQPSYNPHIITGPSPQMFALPGSGWKVEATSFEHVALAD
jgi:hypothetical protein